MTKYQQAQQLIDKTKTYTPAEGLALAKQTSRVKFDASIEVHCKLGIDPKKGEQQVRGNITFPHSTGKTKRVAAFVDPNNEDKAKEYGADLVGGEQLISEIASSGKIDFDVAIAIPAMMPKLAKIAKLLGPKGLMPNPKAETVTTDLKKTIAELKKGKLAFKNDDTGNVHLAIGKASLINEQLLENFTAFMDILKRSKPASSKGIFIQSCILSSTMGPAIKIAL